MDNPTRGSHDTDPAVVKFDRPRDEYTNHETDDQGFPLCRCDACREKSKIRNAQELNRMFAGLFKQNENVGDFEEYQGEAESRDVDHRGFNLEDRS